jgi:hypothetical protein
MIDMCMCVGGNPVTETQIWSLKRPALALALRRLLGNSLHYASDMLMVASGSLHLLRSLGLVSIVALVLLDSDEKAHG